MNWSRPLIWSLESISIIAPTVVAVSLLVGIVFYSVANSWDLPLAYYFAASVLFGDMYLIPTESNSCSHIFTLFYFLWGTTLLAGALAAAANFLIRSAMRIAAEERKKYFELSAAGRKSSKTVISDEVSASYLAHFLAIFNWSGNRSKYLAVVCAFGWLLVGVLYGLFYEGWSFSHSLLFSLAAMSTAGNISPICEGNIDGHCALGTPRALFIGTYLIIGVPIFAFTVAQFAEILVERAIKANEQRLMTRPLTEEEFQFAYELHEGKITQAGSDESSLEEHAKQATALCDEKEIRLDLGDFIVLELLRLQKVTVYDLRNIKALFDMLDEDGDGVLVNYPRSTDSDTDSNNNIMSPSVDNTSTSLSSKAEEVNNDSNEAMHGRYGSLSAIQEVEEKATDGSGLTSRRNTIDDLEAQTTAPLISSQVAEHVDNSNHHENLWHFALSAPFSFSMHPLSTAASGTENRGAAASVDETASSHKISDRYNQLIMQHLRHSDPVLIDPQHTGIEGDTNSDNKTSNKSSSKTRTYQSATEDSAPTLQLHRSKSAQSNQLLQLPKQRRNTVTGGDGPPTLTEKELLLTKFRTNRSSKKHAIDL